MYSVFPFSAVTTSSGKGFQCVDNLAHSQGFLQMTAIWYKHQGGCYYKYHRRPGFVTTLSEFASDILALPDSLENHKEFFALVLYCAFKDLKSKLVFQKNLFHCFLKSKLFKFWIFITCLE